MIIICFLVLMHDNYVSVLYFTLLEYDNHVITLVHDNKVTVLAHNRNILHCTGAW